MSATPPGSGERGRLRAPGRRARVIRVSDPIAERWFRKLAAALKPLAPGQQEQFLGEVSERYKLPIEDLKRGLAKLRGGRP